MNNNVNKNNLTKKKTKKYRNYELELYFKNNTIKKNNNNKNKKNNKKRYKYNKENVHQITKVLVNDEIVIKESVKSVSTFQEDPVLIKKKETSIINKNNKDNKLINKNEFSGNKKKILINKDIKEANKKLHRTRIKKYLKEAFIFTLIITIIDIILYFVTDEIPILRLFDINYLNIIVTVFVVMLLLFIGSFISDYLISELLIRLKKRKIQKQANKKNTSNSGGDLYRNRRSMPRKYPKNIKIKR